MNQGSTVQDREGFAALLLRLRGKGSVPKALVDRLSESGR